MGLLRHGVFSAWGLGPEMSVLYPDISLCDPEMLAGTFRAAMRIDVCCAAALYPPMKLFWVLVCGLGVRHTVGGGIPAEGVLSWVVGVRVGVIPAEVQAMHTEASMWEHHAAVQRPRQMGNEAQNIH
jgi:hypothetical protein